MEIMVKQDNSLSKQNKIRNYRQKAQAGAI